MNLTERVSKLEQIVELQQDKEVLKNWMHYCLKREDWHGVMDAAADIREIVAKLEMLTEVAEGEPKPVSYCSDCDCGKAEGCGS